MCISYHSATKIKKMQDCGLTVSRYGTVRMCNLQIRVMCKRMEAESSICFENGFSASSYSAVICVILAKSDARVSRLRLGTKKRFSRVDSSSLLSERSWCCSIVLHLYFRFCWLPVVSFLITSTPKIQLLFVIFLRNVITLVVST